MNTIATKLVFVSLLAASSAFVGCGPRLSSDDPACADRDPSNCGDGCRTLTASYFIPERDCWSPRRPFECIPDDRPCGNAFGAFRTENEECVQVQYSCVTQTLAEEKECSARMSDLTVCSTPDS